MSIDSAENEIGFIEAPAAVSDAVAPSVSGRAADPGDWLPIAGPVEAVGAHRGRGARAAGASALIGLVALSLLLVSAAANRPSFLASATTSGFFPSWLAGPLGGMWPQLRPPYTSMLYLASGAIAAMFACYIAALTFAPRLHARWTVASILAVHGVFFLSPPLQYTDVFNYINYGRMAVVHHLNPYATIPLLEPHSDASFALSNWHGLLSPYGSLFTQLTEGLVPFGVPASFWILKLLDALASLGTLMLVWRCASRLGRSPLVAVIFLGLNPLVLVWGLGADHYDSLMLLFLVLALYLILLTRPRPGEGVGAGPKIADRGRHVPGALTPGRLEAGAGAAIAVAVAVKISGGILLPLFLAYRRSPRVLLGFLLSGVVLAGASLVSFGPHIPDLSTQSSVVSLRGLPNLLGLALGSGGETSSMHVILTGVLILAVALCSLWAWRSPEDWATAAGVLMLVLVLTISWTVPWYILWVLPFAALSPSRRLRMVTLLACVYFILAFMPAEPHIAKQIGFHPESTTLGRHFGREVQILGG